jgi:MFS family permease
LGHKLQAPGATRARYIVIVFMVTLAMVTYLDRACIGAMAPQIAVEFSLDEAQMSWVFTAFILSYALFEIPTARWADRRGARAVLTRIVSWWSVFTIVTAGAFNYVSLLAARFLFGAGEAGAWPCVARVMSRWVPARTRGTAKGIFFAGAYASAALTTAIVTPLLAHLGWRVILVAFGCVGFVWIVAWRRWFRDEPTTHPAVNEAECALILADRPPAVRCLRGWAFWRKPAPPAQRAVAVCGLHAELRYLLLLHHLAAYLPDETPWLSKRQSSVSWRRCRWRSVS